MVQYLFSNFGPLIAFYAINHFFGLKPAIAVTLVVSIVEVVRARICKEETTAFFKFSTAIALVFGVVDLCLTNSFLFKYEPSVTNAITGLFFGATIFSDKPLIQEFYEKRKAPDKPITPEQVLFFRLFTALWVVYFFAKAAFYYWVSRRYSIEKAMVIRGLAGNISLCVLLFGSFAFGRRLFGVAKKLGLLRSAAPRSTASQ